METLFGLKDEEGKDVKLIITDDPYKHPHVILQVERIEPKPEFKVGQWVIGIVGYEPKHPARILNINNEYADLDMENGDYYRWRGGDGVYWRLCTPQEIETHLRKICDKKYIGKKIDNTVVTTFDEYEYDYDSMFYRDGDHGLVTVYKQGQFVEIIPDKKSLPKDRKGIGLLIELYHGQNDGLPFKTPIDEFLNEYED
jgi:hypothetical protein